MSNVAERFQWLRSNVRRRADDVARDEEGAQALRLVRGFEAGGSGWFWETDRAGLVTYMSPRIADALGARIGEPLAALFAGGEGAGGEGGERTLGFHLHARTAFTDLEVRSGHEGLRSWSLSGRPLVDEFAQFHGFAGSGSDLTAKQLAEAEVTRLALYDPLTGLANRARIGHALEQALARAGTGRARTALLLLDLDRFKAVNDTLGHQVGDTLLKQVAARLRVAAERMGTSLVGRLGGDEFQIVTTGDPAREDLTRWSGAIITALSRPFQIAGSSISIGASVGIAVAPDDGDTAETLVRNADLALYAAKAAGRGVARHFQPAMLEQARWRKLMEDDLREALVRDQLAIVYQPVVCTASGEISGYEALLRWTHPKRGAVSPADFVPVAEESGLIDQIGEWVLRTACAQAAQWPEPVRLAVNVSPVQFGKPALPAIIAGALAAAQLDPGRLELELTESVFLAGTDKTTATFRALKKLGVRLALDDFGTGYSSLGYLQTAPFDKLKIDQSFVRGACQPGSRNAPIIRAIVQLAQALDMETTAEGVEAQDEIQLIRALGCSHIQGFVYGRPVPNSGVAGQLMHGREIAAVGVPVSRAARKRMLRSVTLETGCGKVTARLRDISLSGAMIDQFEGQPLQIDDQLGIELTEGVMTPASVRWVSNGRAGLRLLSAYDFTRVAGNERSG